MTGDASGWTLGLDLGGTACRAVAVDGDGTVLATDSAGTPPLLDVHGAVRFVQDRILALAQPTGPVAIGIGASGPIDADGVIRNPDTLPAFTGLPLVDALEATSGVAVRIDNDAVTAAMAERHLGAARGSTRLLHVTLGTGVGVCLLTPTGPLRRADGGHPEAGHITIAGPTAPCYCGRLSCFEQGASRTALQREAARPWGLRDDDPTAIPHAHAAAASGDHVAAELFSAYADRLADGLSTLISVLGPDLVVLGGSATRAFDAFRGPLLQRMGDVTSSPACRIAVSELDDHGGAIGAALLALG